MFTGIVEDVGTIVERTDLDGGLRLGIESRLAKLELADGASVAVDGTCLTVVSSNDRTFRVEVIGTTLSRTIASTYREGGRVNLERAARVDARLDGHLVQGHVDGIGEVLDVHEDGIHHLIQFRTPGEVWNATIPHGSIALNGVSLTVNRLEEGDVCEVAIIPHTWSHTNFAELAAGDPVNVEGDLIGKYVCRYLESVGIDPSKPDNTEPPTLKA